MTKKIKQSAASVRPELDVLETDLNTGLSAEQVELRVRQGYANTPVASPSKSLRQIVFGNLFTYFNLLFFVLAGCIIAVQSWQNLMFMPVVLCNIIIGIVQEVRAKAQLDKLTLLNSPKGAAIRESALVNVNTADLVRDDIVIFATGNQIYADAVVVEGECQVNEALVTGEADEIKKTTGDELMSGSFVVNGSCRARLTYVGADSYASRLTLEAKKSSAKTQSEMMTALSKLVKWIGIALLPLGVALAYKEIYVLDRDIVDGVTSTVGALVGMIPEGLYLLTSLALVAGILRLAEKKTLVHDLNCIEILARVDILCVDKTGTITENKMTVEAVVPLCADRYEENDIKMIMSDYVNALGAENETMEAMQRVFSGETRQQAIATMPFSSAKKYGGAAFNEDEVYLLGAPDVLLGSMYGDYAEVIDGYSNKGCRVLLLCLYDGSLEDKELTAEIMPLSLILLNNKVRPEAPKVFKYFTDQGVGIRVISGDNHLTVAETARRAGIPGSEKSVDARELTTDEAIAEAALKYCIFGRVTPEQKRKLVEAMKAAGHTVAMTGDGVNDVLALKASDCGIAMASGADVAAHSAHIVLLDSNFDAMPAVVAEGRRVINNIERSASLFLVKNIFSFLMALISLFAALPYPVSPAQLSLVSTLTIGIPSFFLALEPNRARVRGKFMTNIMYRALPGGLTNVFLIIMVLLFFVAFNMDQDEVSTICAVAMGVVGLIILYRTCQPLNRLRVILLSTLSAAFCLSVIFLRDLFTLSPLHFDSMMVLAVVVLLAYPVVIVVDKGIVKLREYLRIGVKKLKKN